MGRHETGTFMVEQVYRISGGPGRAVVGTLKAPELCIGDRLYLRDGGLEQAFTIAAIDYSPASGRFGLLLTAAPPATGATDVAELTDVSDVLEPGVLLHTAARYRTVRPARGCPDNM